MTEHMQLEGLPEAQRLWDDGKKIEAIKLLLGIMSRPSMIEARKALDPEYAEYLRRKERDKFALEMYDELVAALEAVEYEWLTRGKSMYGRIGAPTAIFTVRALLKRCKGE